MNFHFQKLERMYLDANVQKMIYDTTTISISEGEATVGLTIHEKYFHAADAIHGSVYFKLLDDAAFFAANSLVEDVFVLTANFNVNLIRPCSHGKLKSVGKVRFRSKNTIIAESTIYNEDGKEIGFGSGTFLRSNIALTEEIGYK